MICPNKKCRKVVPRLVCKTDKRGKSFWGCVSCIRALFEPHVYTGRKLWAGNEVYGNKLGSDELRADTEAAMRGGRELSF